MIRMTEKQCAIACWYWIYMKIYCDKIHNCDVVKMKRRYCIRHHIGWLNECYFCDKIAYCSQCPLVSCTMPSAAFEIIWRYTNNYVPAIRKERALEAVAFIIRMLEAYPDEGKVIERKWRKI